MEEALRDDPNSACAMEINDKQLFTCYRVLLVTLGMMEAWVETVIEESAVSQELRVSVVTTEKRWELVRSPPPPPVSV